MSIVESDGSPSWSIERNWVEHQMPVGRRDQDGGPSDSTIDIYDLTENWGLWTVWGPSLGACNYPQYSYHGVFTDRSIFSLKLSRIQIPTGTSVTNCNQKHGLMLTCRHDVNMLTWGRIVLSSPKRAYVDWNLPISREKYLTIRPGFVICACRHADNIWCQTQRNDKGVKLNVATCR